MPGKLFTCRHWIKPHNLRGRYYYHIHSWDEETGVQKGQECAQSHTLGKSEAGVRMNPDHMFFIITQGI